MPEDIDPTVSEQESDDIGTEADESDAFNEDTEEDKAEASELEKGITPDTEEEDDDSDEAWGREDGDESEEDVKPEEEPEKEPETPDKEEEKEPTAAEKAEAFAKENVALEEPPPEKSEEDVKPPEKPTNDEEKPEAKGGLTQEKIDTFFESDNFKALPEETRENLKEMQEVDPENLSAIVALSDSLSSKRVDEVRAETNKIITELSQTVGNLQFSIFSNALAVNHPDWNADTDTPEYKAWYAQQSPEVQALGSSWDVEGATKLMDAYYESTDLSKANEQIEEIDKNRDKAKEDFDAVHKTTVRSSSKPPEQKSQLTPEQEEQEGFESDDEDDDDLY